MGDREYSPRMRTYSNSNDFSQLASSSLEDGFNVLATLRGLVCSRAFDELPIGVSWDLSCNPDLAGSLDRLTVWPSRCRNMQSVDPMV